MQFIVTVIDKHVSRLEEQDDTTFINRLQTLIVKELQGYSSDVYRSSVRVQEVCGDEKIFLHAKNGSHQTLVRD